MNLTTLMKVVFGLLVVCIATPAIAGETHWLHAPETPGDWWNAANWTAGLPIPEIDNFAYVNNGGTASISSGAAETGWLYLGAGNEGAVSQSGGTHSIRYFLMLGQYAGSTGRYDLGGGELSSLTQVIGDAGTGRFVHTGGVNTASFSIVVGLQKGSDGVYELGGTGQVFANNVSVGREGTGRFTQTSGSHTIESAMILGAHEDSFGLYELKGGQLSSEMVAIGPRGGGAFEHSAGTNTIYSNLSIGIMQQSYGRYELSGSGQLSARNEYLGMDGGGSMTQTGGTNTVSGDLVLAQANSGDGAYELAEGELSAENVYVAKQGDAYFYQHGGTNTIRSNLYIGKGVGNYTRSRGTYELTDGSLSVKTAYIGYSGNGHFLQNGGTVTIQEDLYITYYDRPYGRYTLTAGELTARNEYIGKCWEGKFLQTGGTHVVLSSLEIRGSGEYSISGGSLTVSELYAGTGGYQAKFNILDADAAITVLDALRIGRTCTVTAVPESEIHMKGASLFNENDNEYSDRLMGLRDLNLIFEGGLVLSTFEVAGLDVGADAAGFDEQFALGTLTLGGDDVGWVQLVDDSDNHRSSSGVEALYVTNLVVGSGSVLDLNGLNLYYHDATIDPNATIVLNGGQLTPAPEPGALSLLAVGGVAMLLRRRSARRNAGKNLPQTEAEQ